ncbi:MAG TPA: hypothetical protein VJ859_13140 [Allosphingosinicella sp.]|nr:hypothetical protein [Allosphingosinicella sp.]
MKTSRLLVLILVVLAACSQRDLINRITSDEDRTLGRNMISALQQGNEATVLNALHPQLEGQIKPIFSQMRQLTPRGPGTTVDLVDAGTSQIVAAGQQPIRTSYLAFEVSQARRHALVRIGIRREGRRVSITDLYVNPTPLRASEMNRFSFAGKGAVHYLFVSLALISFGTIVAALILLAKSRGIQRRWLWALACLIAVGRIGIDWTTGTTSISPLYVMLFGASVVKPGALASWQLAFGIPVVAILFLVQRRNLLNRAAAAEG